jgi:hypothetical protein
MTANHIIALAQSLRDHALASGRDMNAANLFVHTVLMRAMKYDDGASRPDAAIAARALAALHMPETNNLR